EISAQEPTEKNLENAANLTGRRYQETDQALPAEIRLLQQQIDGSLCYTARWFARDLDLLELYNSLEHNRSEHDRLMDADERNLFESFLKGEAHTHLGDRLRDA